MKLASGGITSRRSARTRVPLTKEHLTRLAVIADEDHAHFTRPAGRPEYADRRLLVVLAQGAAQHYLDCVDGVKRPNGINDLDVWTFYAEIPGAQFPAHRRKRIVDFGPSELGRKRYIFSAADNPAQEARWRRWDRFVGRRVDLMVRPLPAAPEVSPRQAVAALCMRLQEGADQPAAGHQSNWYLAQRAVVLLTPARRRGEVVWAGCPAGERNGRSTHALNPSDV